MLYLWLGTWLEAEKWVYGYIHTWQENFICNAKNQILLSKTVLNYSEMHTKITDPAKWHTHAPTHEPTQAHTHVHKLAHTYNHTLCTQVS